LIAVSILAVAPVSAQSLTFSPSATSTVTTRTGMTKVDGTNLSYFQEGTPKDGGGFDASVTIEPDFIEFENGAIGMGAYSIITSTTTLAIEVTNTSSEAVKFDSFESVIIPAGFGFFVARLGAGCTPLSPSDCSYADDGRWNAGNLKRPGDIPPGVLLGTTGFDFRVDVDGSDQYTLQAGLDLVFDPLTGTNMLVENFNDAPTRLNGWTLATVPGDMGAIGYAWDATPFSFLIPDEWLDPGETRTITYISSVYVETFANVPDSIVTMLGYSAFGDPVGRPGGGGSMAAALSAEAFAESIIPNVEVGSFQFVLPYFQDGRLYLPPEGGVIPEPATWAMLIAGFGLVGQAMRRRRTALAA
jgi:hypothetical protein